MARPVLRDGRILPGDSAGFRAVPAEVLLSGGLVEGGGMDSGPQGGGRRADGGEEIVERAREEAARIVEEARRQAAEIVAGARRRVEEEVARAREEHRRQAVERVGALVEDIGRQWEEVKRQVTQQAVAVGLEVARKVIARELETRPEAVVGMAQEVLRRISGGGRVRLVVSGDDAEVIGMHSEQLQAALPAGSEVEIVVEEGMQRGDVVVESEQGEIDARVETQLEVMARELEGHLSDGGLEQGRAAA